MRGIFLARRKDVIILLANTGTISADKCSHVGGLA
jgi:hypothetical protein